MLLHRKEKKGKTRKGDKEGKNTKSTTFQKTCNITKYFDKLMSTM